jgi:hypothetical protein
LRQRFGLDVVIMDYDISIPNHRFKRAIVMAHLIHPEYSQFHSAVISHSTVGSSMAATVPVPRRLLAELPDDEKHRFYFAMTNLNLNLYVNPMMVRQPVRSSVRGPGPRDTIAARLHRAERKYLIRCTRNAF